MQLCRFLSLLWGLFFSQVTHPGSHCCKSSGPGAVRDGQGDMRWGRKDEECMCVWGGREGQEHNGNVTDRLSPFGGTMTLWVYQSPCGQKPALWAKAGDVAVSGRCAYGMYIHFLYTHLFFKLIHKHTHKDNRKIEEGRPYL